MTIRQTVGLDSFGIHTDTKAKHPNAKKLISLPQVTRIKSTIFT